MNVARDLVAMFVAGGLTIVPAFAAAPAWLTGVNLAGAEFNSTKTRINVDYIYPSAADIRTFAGKGFRVFRVPVLASRLLGSGTAVTPDWTALMGVVAAAQAAQCYVILDLHQYGAMAGGLVGRDPAATQAFAKAWSTIAARLKDKPNLIFGLMNEPHQQSPAEWRAGAAAGLAAIRAAGANQLVLVPGTAWDGAHSWVSSGNAAALADLRDPNLAFEVHQYLDPDSSGTHPDVVAGAGAQRLQAFTAWARAHHVQGFLGEFGFAATPAAMKEGGDLVAYIHANKDVWRGWTYWAAGPWWGNYMFSVEPGKDGADKPQTTVLERWK